MATDNSENSFERALREERSGPELAAAFTGFNFGLLTRLNDVEGRLSKTIVEQANAGRYALGISSFTFALLLAFAIFVFTVLNSMQRDIGSLNTLTTRMAVDLRSLENTVSAIQEQVNEVLATVRSIDERTREMADRADVNPGLLPDDPLPGVEQGTDDFVISIPHLLSDYDERAPTLAIISPRDIYSRLRGDISSDAVALASTMKSLGINAVPLKDLVSAEESGSASVGEQLSMSLQSRSGWHLAKVGTEHRFTITRQSPDEVIRKIERMSEGDVQDLIAKSVYLEIHEDDLLHGILHSDQGR